VVRGHIAKGSYRRYGDFEPSLQPLQSAAEKGAANQPSKANPPHPSRSHLNLLRGVSRYDWEEASHSEKLVLRGT
jgi:hypothetical protein